MIRRKSNGISVEGLGYRVEYGICPRLTSQIIMVPQVLYMKGVTQMTPEQKKIMTNKYLKKAKRKISIARITHRLPQTDESGIFAKIDVREIA